MKTLLLITILLAAGGVQAADMYFDLKSFNRLREIKEDQPFSNAGCDINAALCAAKDMGYFTRTIERDGTIISELNAKLAVNGITDYLDWHRRLYEPTLITVPKSAALTNITHCSILLKSAVEQDAHKFGLASGVSNYFTAATNAYKLELLEATRKMASFRVTDKSGGSIRFTYRCTPEE